MPSSEFYSAREKLQRQMHQQSSWSPPIQIIAATPLSSSPFLLYDVTLSQCRKQQDILWTSINYMHMSTMDHSVLSVTHTLNIQIKLAVPASTLPVLSGCTAITIRQNHHHLLLLLLPFYGPPTVPGTTQVSRYQKCKTSQVKPIWIYWSKK